MGAFSRVIAELECERCHSTYRTDVQFNTDNDRDMPEYTAGQIVHALPPDSLYEGMANAFCAGCMKQWIADEKVAHFEALATAVELSELAVKYATYRIDMDGGLYLDRQPTILRHTPLTPSEVRRLANSPEGIGWPNFWGRLKDASVELFVGESVLDDSEHPWMPKHFERVEAQLSEKGWRTPPDSQFRDVTVRIDNEGRISIVAA